MQIPQTQILCPKLKLAVADTKNSKRFLLTANIDTGYNGILTIPKKFIDKLSLEILGSVEYEIPGGLTQLNYIASGLVFLPEISNSKSWIVDIDIDETNTDILIGTGFLEKICLDLKVKFCLNFAAKQIELLTF